MRALCRRIKDPFAGLSHWLGALLAVAGLVVLLVEAEGHPRRVVAYAIFGTTLILLYAASALAHSIRCSPKADRWLTRADFIAIFLLIAGTYTPYCLLVLPPAAGTALLVAEWACAAVGIGLVVLGWAPAWPRVAIYLVMGWLALLAAPALLANLPAAGLAWLIGGGVAYTVGAFIFLTDRPHLWPGRFHAHDLWHCLVLVGSGCHFVSVAAFIP